MTKLSSAAIVFAVVLAVAACTSVKATQFPVADRYAPVATEEVHVFTAEEEEPRCYELLAELEGSGSMFNSREAMVEDFRRKAAELGANGVLLRGFDESTWRVQGKEGSALAIRHGVASCEEDG